MFMTRTIVEMWRKFVATPQDRLPSGLREILQSKFIEAYDCIVLDSMLQESWRPAHEPSKWDNIPTDLKEHYPDRTNFERIVSKIHVDDYLKKASERKAEQAGVSKDQFHFQNALSFLVCVFKIFRVQYPALVLRGIISMNDGFPPENCFSCCVYYHVKRDGESWLHLGLNYDLADDRLFVIDSDELPEEFYNS